MNNSTPVFLALFASVIFSMYRIEVDVSTTVLFVGYYIVKQLEKK